MTIEGNQVSEFFEKPNGIEGFVNGGYFVFNRRIFDYLDKSDNCDLEYGPIEKIVAEEELMVYRHGGFWACMDTIREMEYLNRLWNDGNAPWKVW